MSPNNKPAHSQPVIQIKITAMSDGNVNITGFPNNLRACLDILYAGGQAIIAHYIAEAKAGNLDEHNNIIPSQVLTPKPGLVDMQGRAIQGQ